MFDITHQVLTPDALHPAEPQRNGAGQVVKGNSASPGRKKRSEEAALLAVLDESLPPDKFKEHMNLCIAWAIEYKSPKLLMQLWQFRFAYTIGQPVQRSVSASGKLENILDRISSMDESEFEAVERALRGE